MLFIAGNGGRIGHTELKWGFWLRLERKRRLLCQGSGWSAASSARTPAMGARARMNSLDVQANAICVRRPRTPKRGPTCCRQARHATRCRYELPSGARWIVGGGNASNFAQNSRPELRPQVDVTLTASVVGPQPKFRQRAKLFAERRLRGQADVACGQVTSRRAGCLGVAAPKGDGSEDHYITAGVAAGAARRAKTVP